MLVEKHALTSNGVAPAIHYEAPEFGNRHIQNSRPNKEVGIAQEILSTVKEQKTNKLLTMGD